MISLANEQTISLAAAARMLPPGRRGRPVNLSTILRWVLDGVRGSAGQPIRLEAVRMGGRWLTSVEALERFAAAQTPRLDGNPSLPRSPTARGRASDRAAKELEKLGI